MQAFTLLIKPTGSDCNLNCTYCFYKDRAAEIGSGRQRMSCEVLERLVADYLALDFPVAGFSWQGGEPTLMGLDFFQKAAELQEKHCKPGQRIDNALQTNAVLLDEQWCRFLHDNNFLTGISIDGPGELHDHYRTDHAGNGTFHKVMRAINLCKQYAVEFNTLTLLNDKNVEHADELFDFLVKTSVRYMQFITCVEPDADGNKTACFSVTPQQYGRFLCRLFDRWWSYGPNKTSIRDFDSMLSHYVGGGHTICTFGRRCSQYIVVEHNGDCFPCDFFVEPQWRLGNILDTPIGKLAACDKKRRFALAKQDVCNRCFVCRHLSACRGGCLKDRSVLAPGTFAKESYLCDAYKEFFDYAGPRFMQLAAIIAASGDLAGQRNI